MFIYNYLKYDSKWIRILLLITLVIAFVNSYQLRDLEEVWGGHFYIATIANDKIVISFILILLSSFLKNIWKVILCILGLYWPVGNIIWSIRNLYWMIYVNRMPWNEYRKYSLFGVYGASWYHIVYFLVTIIVLFVAIVELHRLAIQLKKKWIFRLQGN